MYEVSDVHYTIVIFRFYNKQNTDMFSDVLEVQGTKKKLI